MTRGRPRPGDHGFTLLEILIALAIVGALLAIAFGGLRVALGAWTRGEERAEQQQHARGLVQVIGRAIGTAYPYTGALGEGVGERRLLFTGAGERLEFVATAAPFPSGVPAAFTAVVIALEDDAQLGKALVIRQRVLPNREPFSQAAVVLRDATVQGVEFRYMSLEGAWADAWDAETEERMPAAVSVRFTVPRGATVESQAPMIVSLRVGTARP